MQEAHRREPMSLLHAQTTLIVTGAGVKALQSDHQSHENGGRGPEE